MKIAQIPVGSMLNFSYIVYDEKNSIGAIIDPSWDLEKLLVFLEKNNITAKFIINTHTHFDHILGNDHISEITKAEIIQHEKSTQKKERSVVDHENISIGDLNLEVLYTPGHSEDSICLIVNKKSIITGDTLFVGNCGRVDLPGSNPEKMYDSLSKVANLDDSLVVYPGHNYGSTPTSTILIEKTNNPMLNFKTKEAFLKYMVNED
ncbi:MAG TPA: hydroxyacylglutathione hydrolase family protein [Nitrososphaeraceae archaeon]|jgi:hydroxyacylglutathione hydrolase|nr:hydroxyacylglutathione hydrolase family protein [Nitrososphaeraceae archaeon]